jgi:hypothetical protein
VKPEVSHTGDITGRLYMSTGNGPLVAADILTTPVPLTSADYFDPHKEFANDRGVRISNMHAISVGGFTGTQASVTYVSARGYAIYEVDAVFEVPGYEVKLGTIAAGEDSVADADRKDADAAAQTIIQTLRMP